MYCEAWIYFNKSQHQQFPLKKSRRSPRSGCNKKENEKRFYKYVFTYMYICKDKMLYIYIYVYI